VIKQGVEYPEELLDIGLSEHEAAVYELLIRNGAMRASRIAKDIGVSLSRPMIYAILNSLLDSGLIEKQKKTGEVAQFSAAHPSSLQLFAERQKEKAESALSAAAGLIPKMVSAYNLSTGRPGVRFYEGDAGMQDVLNDSLTSRETIYALSDLEAIARYLPDVNKRYVEERIRRNINKRGLVPDTSKNRAFMKEYAGKTLELTETRFLPLDQAPFSTVMQIYDNKVSYCVLGEKNLIGVIISDPRIYTMHRTLFEYLWSITHRVSSQ